MLMKEFDFDLADADPDGICEAQTPAGAGNMSLNGALVSGGVATMDYARRLVIASDGNESGVTFTITSTDPDGYTVSEVITGPNATSVESTIYCGDVAQIAISGAGTGNITIGTVDEICSQTIPLDSRSESVARLNVDVTGTIDFTVQQTFDDVQVNGQSAHQNAQWLNISALATKTADTTSEATQSATAVRFIVNSHSAGAEAQMNLLQPNQH